MFPLEEPNIIIHLKDGPIERIISAEFYLAAL